MRMGPLVVRERAMKSQAILKTYGKRIVPKEGAYSKNPISSSAMSRYDPNEVNTSTSPKSWNESDRMHPSVFSEEA